MGDVLDRLYQQFEQGCQVLRLQSFFVCIETTVDLQYLPTKVPAYLPHQNVVLRDDMSNLFFYKD